MLKVLDLFSGIGGFSLGLERTGGFETVAFCEIDPFCRKVLAKHWPSVKQYDDVRTLTAERLSADGIVPDVICGGFPCQDISFAGKGAGIEGKRSGLWSEYARLIGELRPEYVIVENVAALLSRGLDRVLGDLASIGFDAEWHCIPASAVGAPHRRDRLWLVAYAELSKSARFGQHSRQILPHQEAIRLGGGCASLANTASERCGEEGQHSQRRAERAAGGGKISANANSPRLSLSRQISLREDGEPGGGMLATSDWWRVEPDVGRVAHGVPNRVDRLRALGNAVVPQIPEIIGRAILEARAA